MARQYLALLIGLLGIGCRGGPGASGLQRGRVGFRYPPWPEGLESFSVASLRDTGEPRDSSYSLEWVRWPQGDEVWLTRRRAPAPNGWDRHLEVRAVLRLGRLDSTEAVSLTECELNGRGDVRVLGVGAQHQISGGMALVVRAAWKANTHQERFDRLPKDEVECAGIPADD